jgi:PAS domain-containing protein
MTAVPRSDNTADVLQRLLVAGSFILFYEDIKRMLEFAARAIKAIPGVQDILFCISGQEKQETVPDIFPGCDQCPDINTCSYEDEDRYRRVPVETAENMFGFGVIAFSNRNSFEPFEAAVYNFTNAIAMRLENLEYQRGLEEQVRQRTAELAASRAFLQSLVDNTGDSLLVLDTDFSVLDMNPAARRLIEDTGSAALSGNLVPGPVPDNDPDTRTCHALLFGKLRPCENCPALRACRTDVCISSR